jgi:predicted dehydrogenase
MVFKQTVHTVPAPPANAPRVLIIGAGSRGNAYAAPMYLSGLARIVSVAEPRKSVRQYLVTKYMTSYHDAETFAASEAGEGTGEFDTFDAWLTAETKRIASGKAPSVNVACVCVMDEMHIEVVKGLAGLGGIHVLCEKPLATTLKDCLEIYGAVSAGWKKHGKKNIFGVGHVLRYAPHNVLLRKLARDDKVVGDIMSVEHTEPIGWWHYDHSYVRQVIQT